MFEHVYCKADQKQKSDSTQDECVTTTLDHFHQVLISCSQLLSPVETCSAGAPFSYYRCDEGTASSLRTGGANDITIRMRLDGSEWSSTGSGVTGAASGQGINQHNAINTAHRREMKELQDKCEQVT